MPDTENVTTGTVDADDTLIGTQDSTLTRKFTVSSIVAAGVAALIGVSIQAYDADLSALAGVTSAADRLPYFTGSGTATVATYTAAARTVDDDATVAAMVDTLFGAASSGTGGALRVTGGTSTTTTLAGITTVTGQVSSTPTAWAYASPSLDANAGSYFEQSDDLDGNITMTITNIGAGEQIEFTVRQDGTGSRTVGVDCSGLTDTQKGGSVASAADAISTCWVKHVTADATSACHWGCL